MRYRCVDPGTNVNNHDELITMEPTLEEKKHILDLAYELEGYVAHIHENIRLPQYQRIQIADRMKEIKNEMKAFRERYPDA